MVGGGVAACPTRTAPARCTACPVLEATPPNPSKHPSAVRGLTQKNGAIQSQLLFKVAALFFLIFILRSIEKATAIRSFAAMARPHNQLQYIL